MNHVFRLRLSLPDDTYNTLVLLKDYTGKYMADVIKVLIDTALEDKDLQEELKVIKEEIITPKPEVRT